MKTPRVSYPNHKAICRPQRMALWAALAFLLLPAVVGAAAPNGSTYVSLDSWIYPAFDRMAALGAINTQFVGLRPWTREMCARLVMEAEERGLSSDLPSQESQKIYTLLEREFRDDIAVLKGESSRSAEVDSMYTRVLGIAGAPLRDSSHFGQTIANDFGRPYGKGFSNVTGISARFAYGRYYAAVRGEYQHAPAFAGLSESQRSALARVDRVSWEPYAAAQPEVNRFDLLDTYVGVRIARWNASFGKQSLWWGPGSTGAMLINNNIDPMYMFKLDRVEAFHFPGVLRYLGAARIQLNIAKMSGHYFPARPIFHAEKISFKPTENFEIGFSRSVVFLGEGRGLTFGRLWNSYFSVGDNPTQNLHNDPGDRKGGLDFSYRVPGLRRWLTLYNDSFSDDDPSPLAAPHRAVYNPGIYMPQLPGLPNVDLRVEGASTDLWREARGGHFVLWNTNYRDSYTNKGFLLSNTAGREGTAIDTSTTYWLSARDRVQFGWRHGKVDKDFIPSGGTQNTFRLRSEFLLPRDTTVSLLVQHERWTFPFLATGLQSNTSAVVQIMVKPGLQWAGTRSR